MLNSLQNGRCSFIFITLLVHTNTPYNHHGKSALLLQPIFISLFHSQLFTKSSFQFQLTVPFSIPRQLLTSLFCVLPSQQSTPKILSPPQSFSPFRLRQRIRELGTLVRTGTVLISPFLLEVW